MTRSGGSLLESWRTASATGPWQGSDQWWAPAVEALADALAGEHVDVRSASELLGRQRADAGIYLDQARADVAVAARTARLRPSAAAELVDALTLGWVDRTLDSYFTGECVDPLTELATLPYLMTRLAEMYAEASVSKVSPGESHALAVVHTAIGSDPFESETHMITIQLSLRAAFPGGETLARIAANCAIALVPRNDRLPGALAQLRSELELAEFEHRLARTRVWIEALPAQRSDLPAALREIATEGC